MTSQTTPDALSDIVARIESARKAALKPAANVTLIAVSKTHDAARIRPLLAAGQRVFGENRVQEAQAKWPKLREEFADIQLHLIGPLQTNKVKDAVALFDVIHTLDRPKLAGALKKEFAAAGKTCPLFVQVNTGEEEQKAGIAPSDAKDFVAYAKGELGLPVIGLMCIPPVDDEPSPHFAFLRKLAGECGLEHLSMGMSADFETAIRFGASHVRVGSALFGARS
ncbi:MAG TPA: YggS family pyridoxal phosphate-dependent enzyme [Rhizomicrobium sp.]|nr:YggS family pyridoxal phosphate-dependent enzyme [Rhizomicrobium sp.]